MKDKEKEKLVLETQEEIVIPESGRQEDEDGSSNDDVASKNKNDDILESLLAEQAANQKLRRGSVGGGSERSVDYDVVSAASGFSGRLSQPSRGSSYMGGNDLVEI